MREIKFRAWSWKDKLMLKTQDMLGNGVVVNAIGKLIRHYPWDGIPALAPVDWTKDLELMQFTGLHDKNGKEIYEGDVVMRTNHPKQTYVIEFHTGSFWLACVGEVLGVNTMSYWASKAGFEVIGNIYESPELLTSI